MGGGGGGEEEDVKLRISVEFKVVEGGGGLIGAGLLAPSAVVDFRGA